MRAIKRIFNWWTNRTYNIGRYIRKYNCKKVLEVGCGTGALAKYVDESVELWGLDIKPMQHKRYNFIEHNLNDPFSLSSELFDCVVANAVLEHLPDFTNVLKETHRVLNNQGIFIVVIPNPHALGRFICDFHGGFLNVGRDSKGKWRTKKDHMSLFGTRPLGEAHFHYGMMHEWCYVLEKHKFEVVHTEGVGYVRFPYRLAHASLIVARRIG